MIKLKPDNSAPAVMKLDPGVWIKTLKVLSVEDLSNYPLAPKETPSLNSKDEPYEQCLKVSFMDGEYEKHKMFARKWERDRKTKEVIGWSQFMNPVLVFLLSALQGKEEIEINDDWTIPEKMLSACETKEVLFVQYQTNRWYDAPNSDWAGYLKDYWRFTFPPETDRTEIKRFWEENLQWTKDYARDIAIARENEAEENKAKTNIQDQKSFTEEDDDDLPF